MESASIKLGLPIHNDSQNTVTSATPLIHFCLCHSPVWVAYAHHSQHILCTLYLILHHHIKAEYYPLLQMDAYFWTSSLARSNYMGTDIDGNNPGPWDKTCTCSEMSRASWLVTGNSNDLTQENRLNRNLIFAKRTSHTPKSIGDTLWSTKWWDHRECHSDGVGTASLGVDLLASICPNATTASSWSGLLAWIASRMYGSIGQKRCWCSKILHFTIDAVRWKPWTIERVGAGNMSYLDSIWDIETWRLCWPNFQPPLRLASVKQIPELLVIDLKKLDLDAIRHLPSQTNQMPEAFLAQCECVQYRQGDLPIHCHNTLSRHWL